MGLRWAQTWRLFNNNPPLVASTVMKLVSPGLWVRFVMSGQDRPHLTQRPREEAPMKRTFIAGLLSVSLAATSLTATATPAQADEDVFKVIAGLVVLGALANAAKNNNRQVTVHRHQPQPVYRAPKPRRHAKVAPAKCLANQWTHRGNRQVFGARCLQNNRLRRLRAPRSSTSTASGSSNPVK